MKQDEKLFDQRVVARNIRLGFVKEEDYQKHIKTLADDKENCEEVAYEDPTLEDEDESLEDIDTLDKGETF